MAQIIFTANARANGVGLGHAPAGVGQGFGKTGVDLAHLFWRTRRTATAHQQQAVQTVAASFGDTHQVTRHRRWRHHRGQAFCVDQGRRLFGVPAVHAHQLALRAVAGHVRGVKAGDVEQRCAQQGAGLWACWCTGGWRNARHQLANASVQLPTQQRRQDVAMA